MTTTITSAERAKITAEILKKPVLRGLDRMRSKGYAIAEVADALRIAGFELDMVPGDILLGYHNTRRLSFSRPDGEKIENSDVVFTWDFVSGTPGIPNFEFIGYLS
jgi:hypothetical protein